MKLYVKLFILAGGGFGLFRGITSGLDNGLSSGLTTGIIQGIFFGLVMSFFIGKWHRRKTKKMREETGEEVWPVQTKSSSLEGSFDDAFKKSIEALKVINARVKVSDLGQGAIDATTRIGWKSFNNHPE